MEAFQSSSGVLLSPTVRLFIAALVGAGVGLEREWSGRGQTEAARFAGLRTFLLLGLGGGIAGLFIEAGKTTVGSVLLAGCLALTVTAYARAIKKAEADIGATTEAAAIVVIALGALAGVGAVGLAAGAGSLVVLVLSEKTRLHWLVRRIGERELTATLQFGVLALVVLPLLPEGPFGGALALRPRGLWMLVLLLSGLNFLMYLVRRALGANSGVIVSGAIGGFVSSTAVTFDFARRSRDERAIAGSLAFGVLAACTVLVPRVIVVSAIVDRSVAIALAELLWLPAVVGALVVYLGWRRHEATPADADAADVANPLRLSAAIRMALIFQVALTLLAFVRTRWGTQGTYASAAMLGLTDVDALTLSLSRLEGGLDAAVASKGIALGILANTVLKLVVGVVLGGAGFRSRSALGLSVIGVALALSIAVAW